MPRKYQRISADCHLDMLWLPPDLFTTNASSKMRDLMPYVAENADGVKRWTDNSGAEYGLCGGVGATGTPWVPGKQLRADKMAEAGLYKDYFEKGLRRPGDPHLRVKDMDRDGVDAEVIYGILAACAKMKDPEGGRRDAAHLQRLHARLLQHLSRSDDRSGVPALQQHRRRRP